MVSLCLSQFPRFTTHIVSSEDIPTRGPLVAAKSLTEGFLLPEAPLVPF